MTSIDQFESRFRGAAKDVYRYRERTIDHVVVFTDLSPEQTAAYGKQVQMALRMLPASEARSWRFVPGSECASIGDVLALVETTAPDLIVAYRNLHSSAWRWQHSLSDHIEVLTQATEVPVLLLPRPDAGGTWAPPTIADTDHCVMALTDHLAGQVHAQNPPFRGKSCDGQKSPAQAGVFLAGKVLFSPQALVIVENGSQRETGVSRIAFSKIQYTADTEGIRVRRQQQ